MIFISAESDTARCQEIYLGRAGDPPVVAISVQWHAPEAVGTEMDTQPMAFVRDHGGPEPLDVAAAYCNGFVQVVAVAGALRWTRCDLWLGERYVGTIWSSTPTAEPPRRPARVTEAP